ncbi:GH25 family lysozyme [Pedosphaera parvula]|nr:GH25 family lysozyme [Pedosphaera parvula]
MKPSPVKRMASRPAARPGFRVIAPVALITSALTLALSPVHARPLGVDVSSYQGSVNWSSAKSAGISYAWAKATEGNYLKDTTFVGNENNGKSAGVYMGAYHFSRPDLNSPGTEASYFWGTAGGYVKSDGKTLMPMLDVETFNGHVGASSYSDWVNKWCDAITSDASGAGVSVQPVVYFSACACQLDSSVSQWLSWIANYNGENAQTGTPWNVCSSCNPWGGSTWNLWQYTSSGSVSGISGSVDLDVFNGSSAGLVSALVPTPTVAWSGWASLGGTCTSHPSAASFQPNEIDLYVRGSNNQIFSRNWNGSSWTAWVQHGVLPNGLTVAGAPAASANNGVSGREDLYCIGSDGNCYHDWWGTGTGWAGWQNLGAPSGVTFVGAPAATSWAAGRYDVIAVGNNKVTYHNYWTSSTGWAGWQSLGGSTPYDPTAVSAASNWLDVFVAGTSAGTVFHQYWHDGSGWTGYLQDLPQISTSYGLGASSWGSQRMDLFANSGGTIHHIWYNGSSWAPNWNESHPGVTATSAPCATSWGNNRIDVFVIGSDNACWHMVWGQQ